MEHLTQDFIHRKLDGSREAVEAALLAIYDRQTVEEKAGAYTRVHNKVGFSKFDAEFCTSLVEQIKRGRHLTPRQLDVARKKTKRYWRQLVTVMTTDSPEALVDIPMRKPNEPMVMHQNGVVENDEALAAYGSW